MENEGRTFGVDIGSEGWVVLEVRPSNNKKPRQATSPTEVRPLIKVIQWCP
jgi:hypothetical protein